MAMNIRILENEFLLRLYLVRSLSLSLSLSLQHNSFCSHLPHDDHCCLGLAHQDRDVKNSREGVGSMCTCVTYE